MSVFGDAQLFEEFEEQNGGDESGSSGEESIDKSDEDERSKKYKELLRENEKLRRELRLLEQPPNIKVKSAKKDGPIAHVILFNNVISRKFNDEIQDFFCELLKRKVKEEDEPASELQPTFVQYASPKDDRKQHKLSSKRAEALTKAFQAFSSIQVYDKFYIDHLGQPLYFQDPKFSEWTLPQYESVEFGPLSGDLFGIKQVRKSIQRICFNCGGTDHQIKDCEQERDHRAINERRQKFMNEVAKFSQGSAQIRLGGPRYHKDDEAEDAKERFARFKPGVISSELQEALGMQADAIPPYVYQMRRLGYPPGHLHSARIVNSGLLLYEEGEVNGRIQDDEYVPVDTSKLVSYPGFNLPPLPGQEDNFENFGAPPVLPSQSKEAMVIYFEHRNALFKQQKASETRIHEHAKDKTELQDADMDEVDMDMGDEEETNQCIFVEEDEVAPGTDTMDEPTDPGLFVDNGEADPSTVVADEKKDPSIFAVDKEADTRAIAVDEQGDPGIFVEEGDVSTDDVEKQTDPGIFVEEEKTDSSTDSVKGQTDPGVFVVENETTSDSDATRQQSYIHVVEEQRIDSQDDEFEMEIEADVGDLTEEELEVKKEMLLKQLRLAAESSQDSNYRIIPSATQFCPTSSSDMVFATEDSPESPPPEPACVSVSKDTDMRFVNVKTESNVIGTPVIGTPTLIKQRSLSSDTDYRFGTSTSESRSSPAINQTVSEPSQSGLLEDIKPGSSKSNSGEQRLPGRDKFAQGISQFDMCYVESKQPGVYNKLRLLLKDSPRRQDK